MVFGRPLTTPTYEVDVYPFPHPELVTLDIVGMTGPYFFFGALMFNFVIQVGAIVSEKQNKLREILRVMGLKVRRIIQKQLCLHLQIFFLLI
jgi:hypothetical protein